MQIHDVKTQPQKKLVAARSATTLYFAGCNGGIYRIYSGQVFSVKCYDTLKELVDAKAGYTPLYEDDSIKITF